MVEKETLLFALFSLNIDADAGKNCFEFPQRKEMCMHLSKKLEKNQKKCLLKA